MSAVPIADAPEGTPPPYSLRELVLYFLHLGTTGFGGPIALVGYMQRDLVERRGWITLKDYKEGLALAQLAPGPLAAQLAIYLGWLDHGILGATLVAVAFVLPSFVMVLVIAALYLAYGGLPWMQGAFYGIGAAVIAIIGRSAYKLTKSTLGNDRLLWVLFVVSAAVTAWTESELIWLFVLCGVVALVARSRVPSGAALVLVPWPWLLTGVHGEAPVSVLVRIASCFAEAGAFVFGSGLAIVPFLHGAVVNDLHWLTERQFLDAVAVAMITPGPVVITVAFIGYLVAGPVGALVAAVAVFLPCYLLVVVPARYFRRSVHHPKVKAFVDGVTAAAVGAIAGAAFVLGRRAVFDVSTALVALATLAILTRVKGISEPLVILGAGVLGIIVTTMAS
ncbi:MAG TPA: chromate transporter [Candidatus Binatia bacterium]|nr:chromate transporter [Candidatus Binatia bacterium]